MKKQDIIEHLTYNCGLKLSSAISAVEGMTRLMIDTLSKGEDITIRGLGSFRVRDVPQRVARDIHAGKQIIIPPHRAVKFIPSNDIKKALE